MQIYQNIYLLQKEFRISQNKSLAVLPRNDGLNTTFLRVKFGVLCRKMPFNGMFVK